MRMKELLEKISVPVLFRIIDVFIRNFTTVTEETAYAVLTALVSTFDETLKKKIDSLDSVSKCIFLLRRAARNMHDLATMGDMDFVEGHKSCVRMFSHLLLYSSKAISDILDKTSAIRKRDVEGTVENRRKRFSGMSRRRKKRTSMKKAKQETKAVKKQETTAVKKLTEELVSVKGSIDSLLSSEVDGEFDEISLYRLERLQTMLQTKIDRMIPLKTPRRYKKPLSREEKNFEKYKKISFHSDEDFKCLIKALLDPINEALDVLRKIDGDHTADIVLHSTVTSINMACHIFGGL